jgi:hypothetical protein
MIHRFSRLVLVLGLTTLTACTANTAKTASSAPPAAPARHLRVLIDSSRDGGAWWFPQGGSTFDPHAPHQGDALVKYLHARGFEVTELPRPTTIDPQLLHGFDLVIRFVAFGDYSPSEIEAYDTWVTGGGGLLLLEGHHPKDALAEHFGLQFRGVARVPGAADERASLVTELASFVPHPLTHGVQAVPYVAGSGLTAWPPDAQILGHLSRNAYLDLNDNRTQDPGEPSAPAALGVLPHGQGRIVFCGDSNFWRKLPQPLLQNTLAYLATP